jgi:hypothetical protein
MRMRHSDEVSFKDLSLLSQAHAPQCCVSETPSSCFIPFMQSMDFEKEAAM